MLFDLSPYISLNTFAHLGVMAAIALPVLLIRDKKKEK